MNPHFVFVCEHGTVGAQCRCSGPKYKRVISCENVGCTVGITDRDQPVTAAMNPHSLLSRNNDKLTVFRDKSGEYRWKRVAANGKSIAISGESFKNWQDAFDICQSLFPKFPILVDITGTVIDPPEDWK